MAPVACTGYQFANDVNMCMHMMCHKQCPIPAASWSWHLGSSIALSVAIGVPLKSTPHGNTLPVIVAIKACSRLRQLSRLWEQAISRGWGAQLASAATAPFDSSLVFPAGHFATQRMHLIVSRSVHPHRGRPISNPEPLVMLSRTEMGFASCKGVRVGYYGTTMLTVKHYVLQISFRHFCVT